MKQPLVLAVTLLIYAALSSGGAVWAQTDATNGSPAAPESAIGTVASGANSAVEPIADFWRNRREGWFWYRLPPVPKPEAKERSAEQLPSVAEKGKRNKDIEEFEELQHRLENLRKIAIINPTPENVRAYTVYERMAFKQATLFAEMQQALNWVDPVFAEDSADLRPVNPLAMRVWDQQRVETKRDFLSRVAKTHGLYFFVRRDCPYCHAFAPLIKRFSQQTGMTVFPVTLDGGGNREYPKPVHDNGMAARLGIKMVPALVLAQPALREYQVVSFGVVTEEEIMDRIYVLMNERRMAGSRPPGIPRQP